MAQSRVSVVAPFYNQAAFAAETVESVLAQDYPELELIATDDGSSDGTPELLQEYAGRDERVKVVASERNTGIAANLNRGLAAASGELVAWLGGDDVMLPGKIARQVQVLEDRPDAVACCHDAEVFESDSGRVLGTFSQLYNGEPGLRSGGVELQFDPGYFMLPSAKMLRAAAMPAHGYDERLRFNNDWLFHIELLRRGPVVGMPEVLVRYRRHAGNVTTAASTAQLSLEEGLMTMGIVTARYPELAELAHRRSLTLLLSEARVAGRRGERRRAARYAAAALRSGGPVGFLRASGQLARVRARRR